jgi:gamma-glutamyltranspeptidase/glutathione hydrolase
MFVGMTGILLLFALPARGETPMVASGHRLATEAGLAVIQHGGNAVDAAVAVQAMLALVEPQSSGIGGGAYLLFYDAASHQIEGWDGRETAPAAARPDLFLRPDGSKMSFAEAAVGGRAVGVPGVLRMLEAVQRRHGKLPWGDLFIPAINEAETGFAIPARLAGEIAESAASLRRQPALAAMFLDAQGQPRKAGDILTNPALADALRLVAAGGADAMMRGAMGAEIATAVRTDANPGLMTTDDLAAYQPRERPPVCMAHLEWQICSAAPSSSGGITVLQTLALLQPFDMPHRDPAAPETSLLITEAERLAFADRGRYLADPAYEPAPVAGLLDPAYLAARARLIDPHHAMAKPEPGSPPGILPAQAPQPNQPENGTTDLAIVDGDGNAVSMTTTVEAAFGAKLLVHGFLLNNELTDFSFLPEIDGKPVANRVEPGKRPRSSMAPTIVLDHDGHLVALVGSAGGGRIIGYVVQALLGLLDWGGTPSQALGLPHVGALGNFSELEAGTPASGLDEALRARGAGDDDEFRQRGDLDDARGAGGRD